MQHAHSMQHRGTGASASVPHASRKLNGKQAHPVRMGDAKLMRGKWGVSAIERMESVESGIQAIELAERLIENDAD
jgi:hypothetical protein